MSEPQLIQTPCVFGENGNFLLERELGRGGMGGVYMGRDKMLDRPVAVKVMLKEYGTDAAFVERFKKEAQAAARLIHPNIAQIYSYGIADGMPYIAMELVAGGSLDAIMRNSGASSDVPRILKIGEQVAQALRCAADQGLVHGDVKPENVLLDANGNAKLVDFGLAAMQNETEEIWGTPFYIAPEKVRKEVVDYRADMYSLGGSIYHALCGIPPFDGDDANAVVRKRFEYLPRRPSEIRPELTPQIDALVMKMLAFDPTDRYPTFEALLADWSAVLTVGITASQVLNPVPSAGASASATSASSGKKKITIKPKRTLTVKRSGAQNGAGDDGVADLPEPSASHRNPNLSNGGSDEEDEEGSLGGKVALVIGGVIGAIALVAGALWFINEKNKSDNEARILAVTKRQIDVDRAALAEFRQVLRGISTDATNEIKSLESEAMAVSDKFMKLFAEDVPSELLEKIRPAKTARLLAVEKALSAAMSGGGNGAAAAAEVASEVGKALSAAMSGGGNGAAVAAEVEKAIKAQLAKGAPVQVAKFRSPVGDEADPMSPKGKEYLEEKKAWEAAQKAKPKEDVQVKVVVTAAEPDKLPGFVSKMNDLWIRTYDAKAMQLEIDRAVLHLVEQIDASEKFSEYNETTKQNLMALAAHGKATCETLREAKLKELKVESRKIKNALGQLYKDEAAKLADAKARAKQEADEKKRIADKIEQDRLLAEQRAAKIASELASAKDKFEAIAASGKFRQLDWNGAKRELEALEKSFETAEGRRRILDVELKKVNMMKSVQDIFIRNMKDGYVFTNRADQKLFDKMVIGVDADKISVKNKDGKGSTSTVMWQTLYSKHPGIMSELWNKFIRKGRTTGKPKLSLKAFAEAQFGFALTMKFVCPEVEGAMNVAALSVIDAVKSVPQYKEMAVENFPDIDFSKVEAEAASSNF